MHEYLSRSSAHRTWPSLNAWNGSLPEVAKRQMGQFAQDVLQGLQQLVLMVVEHDGILFAFFHSFSFFLSCAFFFILICLSCRDCSSFHVCFALVCVVVSCGFEVNTSLSVPVYLPVTLPSFPLASSLPASSGAADPPVSYESAQLLAEVVGLLLHPNILGAKSTESLLAVLDAFQGRIGMVLADHPRWSGNSQQVCLACS
jgi:hypothetical protein